MKKIKLLCGISLMASPLALLTPLLTTGCSNNTKPEVVDPTVSEIVVTNMPNQTTYEKGDKLSLEGLSVSKLMTDGTKVELKTSEYTTNYIDGDELNEVGTFPVKVTMNERSLSTTFNITVVEHEKAADFVLIRTSSGYCIDGLTNQARETITEISVPEEIDGIPVVEISKGAFKGCINLQSITLPFIGHTKTAKGTGGLFGYVFGDEMYEGCGAYTWQEYSESDEYIEQDIEYAQFAIPRTLKNVTITSASYIRPGAFSNCKYLRNIVVQENNDEITEIGNYAFYHCMALREFTLPSTVQTIGRKSFQACYNLKDVTIPSTTKTIKHNAFSNCISAIKAVIPKSVESMGKLVFENFVSGLVMVEDEDISTKPNWDSEWITSDISVVYGYTSGGVYYTDLLQVAICGTESNKYAYAIAWLGEEHGTIQIPATVTCSGIEYKVKKLGPNMFNGDIDLLNVTIGENVESLGGSCFEGCTNLTSITFPDTLTTLGSRCFYGCNSLQEVDFNKVKFIGESAFEGNTTLSKITFECVETIGGNAFKDCTHLQFYEESPLVFPNTIKSIGDYAFQNCAKYREEPTATTYHAYLTFAAGNNNEVTIGESAFENFGIRTKTDDYNYYIYFHIDFNNIKISKFETKCFKNCYMHSILNFPQETVTEICDEAFYNCTPTYFTTGTTIADRKFVIPSTITSVGVNSFYNWANNRFEFKSDSQLKTIGNYAFKSCSYNNADITLGNCELNIPESVETIGAGAFQYCYGLKKVTFPINCKIKRLESSTFYSCTSLGVDIDGQPNWITIPETITYLGGSLFSGCKELRYVRVKGQITTIGGSCFAGCKNIAHGKDLGGGQTLQSLIFDDDFASCTSFGSNVYQGCEKLVWAPFPGQNGTPVQSNIASIPDTSFADCTTLNNFVVLGNISSIGNAAFRNCTSMTEVTGMTSVKYIYQNAFYGCTNLTSIDIPKSCHTIAENAFTNCKNLGKGANKFILPGDITQAWTTASKKGMGVTPFTGWTSTQTIYFRESNIDTIDPTTGNITTKWGWVLKKEGTAPNEYYTCTASGGDAHFLLYTEV